jgi:hypothetical protein
MNIKLIKINFKGTFAYNYLPFEYCCNEIRENESIEFTDRNFEYTIDGSDELYPIPQFCINHNYIEGTYMDTWLETTNYPIRYCPHCGEKIEVEVVDEVDLSSKYLEVENKRESLIKAANKTDSKKRDKELTEQIRELDQKINWFYQLSEWGDEI